MWILIALGGALALYILFFFLVLFIISKFNKRLRKRLSALSLLLAQRKDIAISLYNLLLDQKIAIPTALKNEAQALINTEVGVLGNHEIIDFLPRLERDTKDIIEAIDGSRKLKKDGSVVAQLKKEIAELDESRRQHIAIYNSDINGYNYWIRLMAYRYLLILFRYREKKRIE